MATCINIPYRCPDCGENQKFSTLQELRMHLQTDHAILVDKSQHRVIVPSISCSNRRLKDSLHSSLLELYHTDAKQLEEIVKMSKEEEVNNKRRRTQCDGLTSKVNPRDCLPRATFREYGHSSRAARYFYPKQMPSKEKSGFSNLYNPLHYSSDDNLKYNGSLFADTEFSVKNNGFPGQVNEETLLHVASQSNNEVRSYTDLCFQQPQNKMTGDKHVINTLTALSHDVLLERASQHATANSLYTTQEVLSGVEQAAEERVVQQQHLIDALAQELKEKERKLANVMHEMENLHRQQLARIEKVNSLNKKYDEEKTDVYKKLNKRQVELDCINKQIIETGQIVNADCKTTFQKSEKCSEAIFDQSKPMNDNINTSSQNVTENIHHNKIPSSESHERDTELASIKMKSAKLEQDRQILITEMHNLLEAAAVENDKLRAQLDDQTQKLCKLKGDLKQSKQDQTDLLDETNTLYHQADVSLSLLKGMLKEREQQLKNMVGSIEQAQTIQEKLEKEKNECLKSSLERETMYKSLLAANSSQVKSVKEILELSHEEKLKLQEELHKMREKLAVKDKEERQLADRMTQLQVELAVKEKTYASMKEKVRRREDKLRKARWEMERVTTYLKVTAKKEIEARSSLETIISGLISRAAKAEADVQQAKSCQVPHFTKCSVPVVQEKVQPLNDIFVDDASVSTPQIASHVTSHLELPDKIHSQDKAWMEKHTMESGKQNAGQLKQQHHQIPKAETIFEQRRRSEVLHYPSSLQQEAPQLFFENTPEIERMIHNIKFEHTKNNNQLNSQNLHKVEEGRVRQITPVQRELGVTDFPLDANGIMWGEQIATTHIQNDGYPTYNNSPLLTQGAEHLKSNDDTDVDEELTDYEQEEDWTHYRNSNKTENWLKSQRTTPNSINRTTMATLQQDSLPLDEKVVKLLYSIEHRASSSSHPVNKNVPVDKLHESKKSKKSQNNNAFSKYNDSTADSFELSPLHKARAVQKRVEQLTGVNSSLSSAHFSSRQSVGFEVNHLEQESDFSSTSYASLEHPHNLFSQKESKQYTEDLQGKVPKESVQCADISTAEVKKSSEAVLVKDKPERSNSISLTPSKGITDVATSPYNNSAVTDLSAAHTTDTIVNTASVFKEDADIEKQQTNTCHRDTTDLKKSENHFLEEDKGIKEQLAKIHHRDTTEFLNVSEDHVLENERHNKKQLTDTCQGGSKEYDVLTSENHILEKDTSCHYLPDQELAKYTGATIMPANDLRTRTMNHSETQVTSSEEDLCDDNSHRKSVDATTDTDLEKLSMPGHLQKGFVVRKSIPNRKHFTRKRSRQRALMRKFQSQESLSSEPDELDTTEKSSRQAVRRMRIALFRVFSYLNTRTLLTVSCVSKEWNRVSRHPALWKHVQLTNSTISSSFLITLSNWCTQTRSLSLQGLHGRSIMAEETPESYQQAIRGSIEPGLEKLLSACHDTMTVLHISDCDNILTDKCLWLVSGYCRLLTSLTYRSSVDPVTPQLIWALGGGCPGITSLFVHPQQPCERKNAMNNKCLLLIGQLYPDIEELGLGGKEFDKAGLLSLIQLCQRLRSLHLDHCLPITTDLASALCTAGLKFLQSLTISGTSVEAKAIHKFKECCRQLNRIHVSVNIEDCVDDPTKKKGQENYKKMVKALEVLKTELGFGVIFTLEATPV